MILLNKYAGLMIMSLLLMISIATGCTMKQVSYSMALATLTADWSQTKDIAARPLRYNETNPILGQHPSQGAVDIYFGSIIALVALSYPFIKEDYAPWVYGTISVIQGFQVYTNIKHGVNFSFNILQY